MSRTLTNVRASPRNSGARLPDVLEEGEYAFRQQARGLFVPVGELGERVAVVKLRRVDNVSGGAESIGKR
jgi:hypothetical protein